MSRRLQYVLCCGVLASALCGCRSTRSFGMDSNSNVPWFGLSLPLPKASSSRKTLETISETEPQRPSIATADLKTREPEPAPARSLWPKWLGGAVPSLPIPPDAPRIHPDETILLEGPREEFR